MSPHAFEMTALITLAVGFHIVCMRLGELHSQVRNLERRLLGDSEADLAKLAEIRLLVSCSAIRGAPWPPIAGTSEPPCPGRRRSAEARWRLWAI